MNLVILVKIYVTVYFRLFGGNFLLSKWVARNVNFLAKSLSFLQPPLFFCNFWKFDRFAFLWVHICSIINQKFGSKTKIPVNEPQRVQFPCGFYSILSKTGVYYLKKPGLLLFWHQFAKNIKSNQLIYICRRSRALQRRAHIFFPSILCNI